MTVVRRHHESNFTIVPNRMMEDKRLSIEAKGLLCYLLSRPHDWTFNLSLIGPLLGIGRDKTERLFSELNQTGYVDRIQERTDGRWGPVEYVVFDEPQSFAKGTGGEPVRQHLDTFLTSHPEKPVPANPVPVKPVPVKPVPAKQGAYKELKETKTERNKDAADDARAARSFGALISPEAFALCDDLMRLQHLEKDDPRCIGTAYGVQTWISKGWYADVIRHAVEAVMSRCTNAPRSIKYFEPAIAEAHAERDRPLPVAIPSDLHRNGGKPIPAPVRPLTEFQRGRKETQEILHDLEDFAARGGHGCQNNHGLLPRNSSERSQGVRGGPGADVTDFSKAGNRSGG
jgi:hypothetical protein